MVRHWYDPHSFPEVLKRSVSVFNLGIVILTALFVFSEFRFDWCERLLGAYLLAGNDERQEKGAIWEAGKESLDAYKSLSGIINRRENTQKTIREADSFTGLVNGIAPEEWVTIEKDEFLRLFKTLPSSSARNIIDPVRLIWLLKADRVDRVFCEGAPDEVQVYFIDSQNRVVHRIDLNRQNLSELEAAPIPKDGSLEQLESFLGRIYPADRFFKAAFQLPNEMITDLILDPDLILEQKGIIRRVGISNQAENGMIRLGFELQDQGRTKILFVQAREWAVWQLGLILKGEIQ